MEINHDLRGLLEKVLAFLLGGVFGYFVNIVWACINLINDHLNDHEKKEGNDGDNK